MTADELELVKKYLRIMQDGQKEIWTETQLLRNLILDRGWMPEDELDSLVQRGKAHPQNIRLADQFFAEAEQKIAEIGLADWLAEFDSRYPRKD